MDLFKNVTWLFFDIGSTIVNEEKAYNHRIFDMIKGTNLTFEQVHRKRLEFAKEGFDGNTEIISFFKLTRTPWHLEDEMLFPNAKAVLQDLKSKGYNLGVIANQVKGTKERLVNWGIGDYFSVIVSSAEVSFSKPDRRIFEFALETANCLPSQAVMIGDRLDNDIKPAKELGMNTVWIRNGVAKQQSKEFGKNCADIIIDSLGELTKIF